MISGLLESSMRHLAALAVLFVVLFVIVGLALAGRSSGYLFVSILRLIASVFYSPIVYLRRSIHGLAGFGAHGDQELSNTKQYLLTKLMLTLQAVLIIVAIGVMSIGLVRAWYAFIPPEHVREAISGLQEKIKAGDSELTTNLAEVSRMDSIWTHHRDSLVHNYDDIRSQNIKAAETDLATAAARARADSQADLVFTQISNYLAQYSDTQDKWRVDRVRDDLNQYFNRISIPDSTKALLTAYTEAWHTLGTLRATRLTGLSDSEIRNVLQSTYYGTTRQVSELQRNLKDYERQLAEWQPQAVFSPKAAGWELLKTIVSFTITVWVLGLLIEALWLAIHIASNVQRIREIADNREGVSPPAVGQAVER